MLGVEAVNRYQADRRASFSKVATESKWKAPDVQGARYVLRPLPILLL